MRPSAAADAADVHSMNQVADADAHLTGRNTLHTRPPMARGRRPIPFGGPTSESQVNVTSSFAADAPTCVVLAERSQLPTATRRP